jgi:SAM-dependent methyltransferase
MGAPLRSLAHAVVSRPMVYDIVQRVAGSRKCYSHLRRLLPSLEHKYVLDAGGGTGRSLAILDRAARYVAVDIDRKKLAQLRMKRVGTAVVGADIASLPIAPGGVDIGLLVFVCHHLDDQTLGAALSEMARVCTDQVLIMDAVWMPGRWRSRLLWQYDEGSYPRTSDHLRLAIDRDFIVEDEERFAVHHAYHIWRCHARR